MKNQKFNINIVIGILSVTMLLSGCIGTVPLIRNENKAQPATYNANSDSTNIADKKWNLFFEDKNLVSLIDSALAKNQELNIVLQEINVSSNEIMARQGAFLPAVSVGAGMGGEKVGRYTSQGAADAANDIDVGKPVPEFLGGFMLGANVSWEVDIWEKLRNAKKGAVNKYLASIDGKNFMVTRLIAEIAHNYYELVALDNQLELVKKNIELFQNSLETVKLEKLAGKATELAVKRFEAELLKNQSHQFFLEQQIIEAENRINFLVGRMPQRVERNSKAFTDMPIQKIQAGIPTQLLDNRPDIKQAEHELTAAKLDVQVTKAEFYPTLRLSSGTGFNAFNPLYLLRAPESIIFSILGDLAAPVINRNAIKANFYSANSKQIQAIFNYERAILNAHIEVVNQLSNIDNLSKSYDLKNRQANTLTESITISQTLFLSARADYMEVLLTQRDALEARFDLIEIKQQQFNSIIDMYRSLGGGWK